MKLQVSALSSKLLQVSCMYVTSADSQSLVSAGTAPRRRVPSPRVEVFFAQCENNQDMTILMIVDSNVNLLLAMMREKIEVREFYVSRSRRNGCCRVEA